MAETVHVYVFNVSNKCFQLTEIATSFIKLDKRFQTMTFYKKKKIGEGVHCCLGCPINQ